MKTLILSVLMFGLSTQASARLTDGSSDSLLSPAEIQRLEVLDKSVQKRDFETFLNTATPNEISQLIQGTVVDGVSEAISPKSISKYKHVFKVFLNQNNHGQAMIWTVNGKFRKSMVVSGAGIPGKHTPRGTFAIHKLDRDAWSRKFKSPMPCAFFFSGGREYAVHGTTHVDHLGAPASNGCIRVDPAELCPVFDEIRSLGEDGSVAVVITETPNGLY